LKAFRVTCIAVLDFAITHATDPFANPGFRKPLTAEQAAAEKDFNLEEQLAHDLVFLDSIGLSNPTKACLRLYGRYLEIAADKAFDVDTFSLDKVLTVGRAYLKERVFRSHYLMESAASDGIKDKYMKYLSLKTIAKHIFTVVSVGRV